MLYLVYAESANYAGYGQYFVVEAEDEQEAEVLAADAIEEFFYDQDDEQLQEEGEEPEFYGSVGRIEEFSTEHEQWGYYTDPIQSLHYIKVNV